ncbi:MAG TPA: prepilin-type N-terminal cleavage/methylation domain-containing protein [Syntrophales bacterium]|nr:prepilin-type N-terminal cleavage/methylation domain-containing protein [Syntrophobacterales bacterium]HQL91250.1 prepilin-type N-terminal cleavage/methylation domain-containing protein [Syntrophales bacterium]
MSLPVSQRGFTLIELVAILVILGVLASIAVPKYYDLTRESQNRAALQAVVEGKSRLSMGYARFFLDRSFPPTPSSLVEVVGATTSVGDYILTLSVLPASSDIRIEAAGRGGIPGTSSGVWTMPK